MENNPTDKTLKAKQFRDIFKHSLKLNARSMSVKTLLSERNLKRINYSPYYQRNYVWDAPKQTFFIESVILGTEIPPLILFKTGANVEVIDGRQRFQTLKRFKENDLTLTRKGLKELQILNKKSFNKLGEDIQEIFLNSNIRVYEFEVVNHPNLSEDVIDRVKKEIFRRYNTGITPLTREELDNAKYDEDEFSELFKADLKSNHSFFVEFNKCFFPKENLDKNPNNDGLIAKNVDFIRRFRVLNSFPISRYAGSERTEVIDLLYEFINENTDNPKGEFEKFRAILSQVLLIYKDLATTPELSNKLIYECILWAITILNKEDVVFIYNQTDFKKHYLNKILLYTEDNSHYYKNIINRYSDTAKFFKDIYKFDFHIYIRDEDFKRRIGELKQTDHDAAKSIDELSNLRLNKPNPISQPIDEITKDLKSTRYLLRPSYQRQEKINEQKASSIIESILLGINLPPIFVYKKKDKTKEVVDGQQRLLAIIGFLGYQFNNENGNLTYSKNNNFKLRGLKILTELEGKNASDLPADLHNKILDFAIDLIIIEESVNNEFDPIDLFIRLNNKPYPIKNNSFEMWNSIVNHDVIKKIKEDVAKVHQNWFFLRERLEDKPDRMETEELITALAYISFNNKLNKKEEVIGYYFRQDSLICRLKDKKGLGDFLLNLDNIETEKIEFLNAIDRTNKLIKLFASLFPIQPTKETFNDFLNVKKNPTFRRSLQDFYLIWLVIDKIPEVKFTSAKSNILHDIHELLELLRNVSNVIVDENYLNRFKAQLKMVNERYLQ